MCFRIRKKILTKKNYEFENKNFCMLINISMQFNKKFVLARERLEKQEFELSSRSAKNNLQNSRPKISKEHEIYSKPIVITEFEEYVKTSIANGNLEQQHNVSKTPYILEKKKFRFKIKIFG